MDPARPANVHQSTPRALKEDTIVKISLLLNAPDSVFVLVGASLESNLTFFPKQGFCSSRPAQPGGGMCQSNPVILQNGR